MHGPMSWVIAIPLVAMAGSVGPVSPFGPAELASFPPESLQCAHLVQGGRSDGAPSSVLQSAPERSESLQTLVSTAATEAPPPEAPGPFCAGRAALSNPACAMPAVPALPSNLGIDSDRPSAAAERSNQPRPPAMRAAPCPQGNLLGPGHDAPQPPVPPPRHRV